jgi:hypothetical protein
MPYKDKASQAIAAAKHYQSHKTTMKLAEEPDHPSAFNGDFGV